MLIAMMPQQYCLRWKHHHSNVQSMFSQLLEKERFCDVTLYCSPSFGAQLPENGSALEADHIKGVSLRAHRVVLAACSELLASLLGAHEALGEPVLVIDGAEPRHLRALLDYMYTGEMNVHHSQLASLLKTAEELRIKGLSDIRWNNKDEPPDCHTASITATATERAHKKDNEDDSKSTDKINVNGGPPPLIKLPYKDKSSPNRKREGPSDSETPSPKRKRMTSATDQTDDEDRDQEWRHGNMDITAERVVGWGGSGEGSGAEAEAAEGEEEEDEWADAPADIGSFLHTRLRVDGDNSADEDSCDEDSPQLSGCGRLDVKVEPVKPPMPHMPKLLPKPPGAPKTGALDSRFSDVIKLNEYLLHGRRPQFWEEDYVKRVMEAVRLKDLEMKQAAEILGVSYGTLYGRYRDVYGCINRPYRNARDFWAAKGPSEVLERLQRGDVSLDTAAQALGVSSAHLAAYFADISVPSNLPAADDAARDLAYAACRAEVSQYGDMTSDLEPIPIEVDPLLKLKSHPTYSKSRKNFHERGTKKLVIRSLNDEEDPIPATVISTQDVKKGGGSSGSGKWPSIRVASLDSLRASTSADATSPTVLMKTRPDLTIVAAKKPDSRRDDDAT